MGIFIFWLFLSLFVGVWASNKGRSGVGFFFLSLLLSPLIGFIAVAVAAPNARRIEAAAIASGASKTCPSCAETIKREAIKCRYCGTDLPVKSEEKPELYV